MNEQEQEKALEVGTDIATYAINKLDGHSLGMCLEVISAVVPMIIKGIHEASGYKNDKSLLTYMEMTFLVYFRRAMDLLKRTR